VRPVYSALLYSAQGLDYPVTISAPLDYLVVLRSFDAYWGGGGSGGPSIRLVGNTGQTIVEFHVPSGTPTPELFDSRSWSWRGRQVIPAGETYGVEVAGNPCDVTLSGYHLLAS
jgi:hypothetical protein